MTNANPLTPPPVKPVWYARPGIVLSLLGLLVLASALATRSTLNGREGDGRLTTTSTAPLGAKMLFELAGKLGFKTERAATAEMPDSSNAILAVLDPVVSLRKNEVHKILEFVRGGGALLIALGGGTDEMSDSLEIAPDNIGGLMEVPGTPVVECGKKNRMFGVGLWLGQTGSLYGLKGAGIDSLKGQTLMNVYRSDSSKRSAPHPAVVGYKFGSGRIVVASDPDVFRNDAIRDCRNRLDLTVVRAMEYLRAGSFTARNRIVFDEYHQNTGMIVGVTATVRKYLGTTPSGHAVLQLAIAGLFLLLAYATRIVSPRDAGDLVERRSPLEHVDALSRAYMQVGASRTAVMRLVSGLRRRLERGTGRNSAGAGKRGASKDGSEEFLARVSSVKPALTSDINAIRHALNNKVNNTQLLEVGKAIERIEIALTRT